MKYSKNANFPWIQTSDGHIVAIIENPDQLQLVINEHNALEDRINQLELELKEALWQEQSSSASYARTMYELISALKAIKFAVEAIDSEAKKRGITAKLVTAGTMLKETLTKIGQIEENT